MKFVAPFRIHVRRASRGDVAERWDLYSCRLSYIRRAHLGVLAAFYWHFEMTVEEIQRDRGFVEDRLRARRLFR